MVSKFKYQSNPWLCFLISGALLLWSACAEVNKSEGGGSSGLVFPHPSNFAEGEVHGPWALSDENEAMPEVCSGCHQIYGPGEEFIPGCWSCHDGYPHTAQISEPRHGLSLLDDSPAQVEKCGGCHVTDGSENPRPAPGCQDCHPKYPHEEDWEDAYGHGLYTLADYTGRIENCASCHGADLEGGEVGQSCTACHTMPDAARASQHEPVEDLECEACHATTESEVGGNYLLKSDPPILCFDCHSEGSADKPYGHSVVKEGDACINCHPAHDADHEGLLQASQPQLCFSCHDREMTSETYGNTRNMLEIYTNSTNKHEPFAEDDCTTCHDVHGSDHPHMNSAGDSMFWTTGDTTDGEIAAYSCLSSGCHDDTDVFLVDSVYESGAWDRPDDTYPTQFLRRSLSWNLHKIHIQDKDASVYPSITQEMYSSCLACHNPHANNDPYLLRDYIEYSDPGPVYWYFSTGCGGCHYDVWPPGTVDDPAFDPW